jgi:hypothetical protein
LWIGFKGGDNMDNHSHLDLGTFNLDALGQRWAVDLGGDDYNMPGYFGNQRWNYYRLRTESHNTLTIDDRNQNPRAAAPLIAFGDKAGEMFAVADLTAAYGDKLAKWRRGVGILGGSHVAVIDEVAARPNAGTLKVTWGMLTPAKVEPAGAEAMLSQGKARWRLRILSPAGAKFATVSANPPPPQNPNTGMTKLVIALPEKVTATTIRVAMSSPDQAQSTRIPESLDAWISQAPVK